MADNRLSKPKSNKVIVSNKTINSRKIVNNLNPDKVLSINTLSRVRNIKETIEKDSNIYDDPKSIVSSDSSSDESDSSTSDEDLFDQKFQSSFKTNIITTQTEIILDDCDDNKDKKINKCNEKQQKVNSIESILNDSDSEEKTTKIKKPKTTKNIKKIVSTSTEKNVKETTKKHIIDDIHVQANKKISTSKTKNTNKISLKKPINNKNDFQGFIDRTIRQDEEQEDRNWRDRIDQFCLDDLITTFRDIANGHDIKNTHTSMKGGSFVIDHKNDNIHKFEYLYVKELNKALRSKKRKQAFVFLQECCNDQYLYRLFADLDSKNKHITDHILELIQNTILEVVDNIADLPKEFRFCRVVRNQDNPNRKIHVIFPFIVMLKRDIKYIMKKVFDYLEKEISEVIDLNYSGLRMIGSLKPNKIDPNTGLWESINFDAVYVPEEVFDRGYYTVEDVRNYSIIPDPDQKPLRLLDTYIEKLIDDEKAIQYIYKYRKQQVVPITGALLNDALNLLGNYRADMFHNWKYIVEILHDIVPNKTLFKRVIHEFSKKYMDKYDKDKVNEYIKNYSAPVKYSFTNLYFAIKQDSNRTDFLKFLKKHNIKEFIWQYTPQDIKFDDIEGVELDEYTEDEIKPFDIHKFIEFILSPMNTKKTQTVINYILKYLDIYNKIVFVTSRISFATSLKKVLSDNGLEFKLYSEKSIVNENYQIIQVESLNKNQVAPDLVVLDEVTSVISQLSSPYHKEQLKMNHDAFSNLIRDAKKVICMDADIDFRAIELIKNLRPNDMIHMQINHLKREHLTAIKCNSKISAIHKLKCSLEEDKNIFIVLGSVNFGRKLEEMVLKPLNIDYQFIYKDTDDQIIKNLDVNREWKKHQVVMITSTITNGVDFHERHFHSTFVFGNSMTNHVRDTKQMMGRVRNLIDNTIYYWNKTRRDMLPYTIQDIKNSIEFRLMRANDSLKKMFTDDEFYNIINNVNTVNENNIYHKRLDDNIFTKMFLMNQVEINLSRNFYDKIFQDMISKQGIKLIDETDLLDIEIEKQLKSEEKEATVNIRSIDKTIYEETSVVDEEELKEIHSKIIRLEATKTDKQTREKNEFLRLFNKRDINQFNNVETPDYAYIDSDTYLNCKSLLPQIFNVHLEINSTIRNLAFKDINVFYEKYNNNDKQNFKPRAIQLECIREISAILGIQGTYDRDTVIKWQNIQENIEWFNDNYQRFCDVFSLRNRSKKNSFYLDFDNISKMLRTIFREWGACKLIQFGKKQQPTIDKKRVDRYNYKLIAPDGFDLLVANLKIDIKNSTYRKVDYHRDLMDANNGSDTSIKEKPRLIKINNKNVNQ